MKKFLFALLALPLMSTAAAAQGNAAAGKTLWEGNTTGCRNCHGEQGQGAFGPDLAGRGLSVDQFKVAVQKPWGIMPAFPQYSDQQLADMSAYFATLPKVAQPAAWRFAVPANAPAGLATHLNLGCGQCHGPTFNGPRGNMGAVGDDFEWFKKLVYDHTTSMPQHRTMIGAPPGNINMGNFLPGRVSEAQLRDIYNWMKDDVGFRPPLAARLSAPATAANGVTYTLNVTNNAIPNKGVVAENVTIKLVLPAGATVVSTTGAGYKGTRMDGNAMVAEWTVPRVGQKEQQNYSITLSKAGTAQDNLRGDIRWARPAPRMGENTDVVAIAPAPTA
jgi:mono/diheme cytochrome c family protein